MAVERCVGTDQAAEEGEGRAVGGGDGGGGGGGGGGAIGGGAAKAEERVYCRVEHGQQPGAPIVRKQ
eukprot:scaffold84936_cov51-Phaeocystis_antarctica.AAC.2